MSEINRIIADMRKHSQLARDAHAGNLRDNEMQILKMRTGYTRLLVELKAAVAVHPKFKEGADLQSDFEDRYSQVRKRISSHQNQWGNGRMHEHPAEYRNTSREVGKSNEQFLSWLEQSLLLS